MCDRIRPQDLDYPLYILLTPEAQTSIKLLYFNAFKEYLLFRTFVVHVH